MKKLAFLSCLVAIAMMTACGNKTKDGQDADSLAADSLTETAVNQDSLRHTVEYITQRLDSIYKMHSDEKGCSEHYKALVEKAGELSMKTNGVFLDGDHWVNGNDIDPKFYAKLKKVLEMNDSTAKVEMNVHNFHDQKIILDLVYERGDWYVDNFHSFYEEDGDNHEMDEVKFLHEYIRQTSNDIYQDKIEKKFGKNFPINKYLDDLRNQWGDVFGVGDNLDLFNEYAVIDIDQDGQPELLVRNTERDYTAVFSLGGGKAKLLTSCDGRTAIVFFEKGVGAQGSCGTGCHTADYCKLENSKPTTMLAIYESYSMDDKLIPSESGWTLNGKSISKAKADEMLEKDIFGPVIYQTPNWHAL